MTESASPSLLSECGARLRVRDQTGTPFTTSEIGLFARQFSKPTFALALFATAARHSLWVAACNG